VYEAMIHDIDLALWYAKSKVKEVYAKQVFIEENKNIPDACLAIITFENNIVASFETNWLIPKGAPLNILEYGGTLGSGLEVIGTMMTCKSKLIDYGFTLWNNDKFLHPETRLWPEVHGKIEGALKSEISHFVNCVLNKESSDIASVDDAVYGLRSNPRLQAILKEDAGWDKDDDVSDKYIVDTVNLNAGDEQIDQIIIISDDMGYDVYFMQKVMMKGKKEVMSEIDAIFIYS